MFSPRTRCLALLAATFFCISSIADATDILLKDGTLLENAEIKGETPDVVYIQSGDQFRTIDRTLVPEKYLDSSLEWAGKTGANESKAKPHPFGFSPKPEKTQSNFEAPAQAPSREPQPFPGFTQTPTSAASTSSDGSSGQSLSPSSATSDFSVQEAFDEFITGFSQGYADSPPLREQEEFREIIDTLREKGNLQLILLGIIAGTLVVLALCSLVGALLLWPFTALLRVAHRSYGSCYMAVFIASILGLVPYIVPYFYSVTPLLALGMLVYSFLCGPIAAALIHRSTPVRGFFSYVSLQVALAILGFGIFMTLGLAAGSTSV